jgi:pimeloyl-ACP methyl ester carboxylesterase
MNRARILISLALFGILIWGCSPGPRLGAEDFENDDLQIRGLDLGAGSPGSNTFSVVIVNRTDQTRYIQIDVRTESIGIGTTNWQRQFYCVVGPREEKAIKELYVIGGPYLARAIISFEEFERNPDTDKLLATDSEEDWKPEPETRSIWQKIIPNNDPRGIRAALAGMTRPPTPVLNEISEERLSLIRSELPGLIVRSRSKEDPARERLKQLIRVGREWPEDFDFRKETWTTPKKSAPVPLSLPGLSAEPFSIAGESGGRIQAFIATAEEFTSAERPLIILLSGNPPGTKESMAGAAAFFAGLGYHAVAIDRRPSSRLWDNKDKFRSYLADPVADALRLIDYMQAQTIFRISTIGLFGISAGAAEGKFVAALGDRVQAAVLACGVASFDWLFRDEAWLPTFSGMMVFPELGLGRPEIGKLTPAQWREYLSKLKPEHNAQARKVFHDLFPFFEDLDPIRVVPLIAPAPLLIVTGAQDEQFKVPGVVEVDLAAQKAYAAFGLKACSELYIGPRIGHSVDIQGMRAIAAFFDRWLKK